jgi:hypothetical protein
MDLRVYYRKLREIEQGIAEEFVIVKSVATPEGGVAGRLTEVGRAVAARLILEGVAELASQKESADLRLRQAQEKKEEDERRAAAKIQFAVLTDSDLRTLRSGARGSKE